MSAGAPALLPVAEHTVALHGDTIRVAPLADGTVMVPSAWSPMQKWKSRAKRPISPTRIANGANPTAG